MEDQPRYFLERLAEAADRAAAELRAKDGDRDHHELIADIDALRARIEDHLSAEPDV